MMRRALARLVRRPPMTVADVLPPLRFTEQELELIFEAERYMRKGRRKSR